MLAMKDVQKGWVFLFWEVETWISASTNMWAWDLMTRAMLHGAFAKDVSAMWM
jgi:hypothetical protein